MKKSSYRSEIDGLRAVAVMSVIVFHAGVQGLSGGFIGVDIFYVISGFLITTIIVNALKKDELSFSVFYIRRIKRLLPAALFMVLATVVFGAVILTPDKYLSLVKSAIYSNLFIANVWFMNNSGYFDVSSQISPLVHMWSLSVEEQFYLLFPFILFVSYRINRSTGVKFVIISIVIISFALSVLLSPQYHDFSFYMLVTRAWELGLGASVAISPAMRPDNHSLSRVITVTGALLISYGLITITHNNIYPGYLALFPVLGTVLIIFATANNKSFIKRVLSLAPLQFLGKISYSAYLWHWPIVVYYRIYINQREFSGYEAAALVVLSVLAGYISWKYIEERYRYKQYSSRKVYFIAFFAIFVSVSVPAFVYLLNGVPSRISASDAALTDVNLMWDWSCTEKRQIIPGIPDSSCVIGVPWEKSSMKGIVWGDSHSQHWAQILHYEALRNGMSLVISPLRCPPYLNSKYVNSHYPKFPGFTENCTRRNNLVLSWLSDNKDVDLVIMAAAWSGHVRMLYTEDQPTNNSNLRLAEKDAEVGARLSDFALRQLLSDLGSKHVLILGDIPRPNRNLNECALAEDTSLLRERCDESKYKYLEAETVLSWHRSSNAVLASMPEEFNSVSAIIPSNGLCDGSRCQTFINNELIYKDGNHIRRNLKPDTAKLLSKIIGIRRYFNLLTKAGT